jgi:hypothetical protein
MSTTGEAGTHVPETHISPAMAQAVGSEIGRSRSHPLTDSDIRRWAIAVYWPHDPPTRFITSQTDGSPLTAPDEINPFAWGAAETSPSSQAPVSGPDATENRLGIEGPGLQRMLNGGLSVEYGVPLRSGDVVTSVKRLGPYSERSGRLGLMLFSRFEDTWTNQDGDVVKRSVMTLIRY